MTMRPTKTKGVVLSVRKTHEPNMARQVAALEVVARHVMPELFAPTMAGSPDAAMILAARSTAGERLQMMDAALARIEQDMTPT